MSFYFVHFLLIINECVLVKYFKLKLDENTYMVKFDTATGRESETYLIKEYENLDETKLTLDEEDKSIEIKSNSKKIYLKSDLIEMDSTSVAYACTGQVEPDEFEIRIKSRVISDYTLSVSGEDHFLLYSSYFCSGSVAELPNKKNNNRYLIFFDNGYVSYVNYFEMFYVFDHLTLPIERLSFDHIYFLKGYFEMFPARIMAQLDEDDTLTFYSNDKWHDCTVLKLDCSLVKLEMNIDMFKTRETKRTEAIEMHTLWLYRGSPRILLVYEMIMNRVTECNESTLKPNSFEKHIIEKQNNLIDDTQRRQRILLHFFSSTHLPDSEPARSEPVDKILSKKEIDKLMGEVIHLDLSEKISYSPGKYHTHGCSNKCVFWENNFDLDPDTNPLLIPSKIKFGIFFFVCLYY